MNHVTTPKLALTDQAAAKVSADVLVIGTVQAQTVSNWRPRDRSLKRMTAT